MLDSCQPLVLSDYSNEFAAFQCFLERWGDRQEVLLEEALNRISAVAFGQSQEPFASSVTRAPTDVSEVNIRSLSEDSSEEHVSPRQTSQTVLAGTRTISSEALKWIAHSKGDYSSSQIWVDMEHCSKLPHWIHAHYDTLEKGISNFIERSLSRSTPANGRFARILRGKCFEMLTAAVIIVNAVWIAVSTDQEVQAALGQHTPSATLTTMYEACFAAFYTFEVVGRMYCERVRFIFSTEWRWNLMDTWLVALAIQDQVLTAVDQNESGQNLTFLRLIRVIRLLKALRIIRLFRIFKELRWIVNSIAGSMRSMILACCLIFIVTFTFGIFLTQGCSNYLDEHVDADGEQSKLLSYWGSVTRSMASLYIAVFGGEDWRSMADSLIHVGLVFQISFLAYIGFFSVVIINTVTSLFVQAAIDWAEKDQDAFVRAEFDRKQKYVDKLKDVFRRMNSDGTGILSYAELVNSLKKPEILAFFSALDLDVHDATAFFKEISLGGSVDVDVNSFVVNCMKCRGWARSIDLLGFIGAQRILSKSVVLSLDELTANVNDLKETVLGLAMRRSRRSVASSVPLCTSSNIRGI